jgi:uncharacterized 2Fe-2S/4Fe-4S cluster protein (DUF4445 family)
MLKITDLDIRPDFADVLRLLGERRENPQEIRKIYEQELPVLAECLRPVALCGEFAADRQLAEAGSLPEGAHVLAVLLTVGDAGSAYRDELLARGEHLRALVVDAMESAWLFAMDEKISERLRRWCKKERRGISGRLDNFDELPESTKRKICDGLDAEKQAGVTLTSGQMLAPAKTMCIFFVLCDDSSVFGAAHSCGTCGNKSCAMRKETTVKEAELKKIQILVENQGKKCIGTVGASLFDILREQSVRIDAPCGGGARCGKCRIQVLSGELPVTPEDTRFLSPRELEEHVRLACAAYPTENLRIRVLAKPRREIATASDVRRQEPMEKSESLPEPDGYSIGVDIGSTTLAACLYGCDSGNIYGTATAVNSGRDFGADVLSRMEASNNGKRARLQELLQEDVRSLIQRLMAQTNTSEQALKRVVIAANMTMVHLLMGYSCERLGHAPFTPVNAGLLRGDMMRMLGSSLVCPVTVLPAVSAFVGGDIVAGMLSEHMAEETKTTLLLDIGTNGEMALCHQGQIWVTSAAAGPAFEGGGISCGCASVPGAISGVKLSGDTHLPMLTTIGDEPAAGICGSGVLELVSELLCCGCIDHTGLFLPEYRENGFPLGGNLFFTQADVRALQLAKGAIRAGLELLLLRAGISAAQVEQVYLAGGFGVRLDETAAITIGLLPEQFAGRIHAIGNSSLAGAVYAGRQGNLEEACRELLDKCREVVLAKQPEFENLYVKYMDFGEKQNE